LRTKVAFHGLYLFIAADKDWLATRVQTSSYTITEIISIIQPNCMVRRTYYW